MFSWISLCNNISWFTLSKAFERARRISKEILLSSIDLYICSVIFTDACFLCSCYFDRHNDFHLINYFFLSTQWVELNLLWIGIIIECFLDLGNIFVAIIDVFIMRVMYGIVTRRLTLICCRLIWSYPIDLVFLSFDIANVTSASCTGCQHLADCTWSSDWLRLTVRILLHQHLQCNEVLPCVGWGVQPVNWIYRLWRHCP